MTITILDALEAMRDGAEEEADNLNVNCDYENSLTLRAIANSYARAITKLKAREAQQEKTMPNETVFWEKPSAQQEKEE